MHVKLKDYSVDEIALLMSFPDLGAIFAHLIMQYRPSFVAYFDDLLVQPIFVEQRRLIAAYAVMLFSI
jgi:hypothetical protein